MLISIEGNDEIKEGDLIFTLSDMKDCWDASIRAILSNRIKSDIKELIDPLTFEEYIKKNYKGE